MDVVLVDLVDIASADRNKSPSRRPLFSKLCEELPTTGDRPEFRRRKLAVGGMLFQILCLRFPSRKTPSEKTYCRDTES